MRQAFHLTAALVCVFCVLPAKAQPVLTQYVPADSIVYLGWAGTDGAGEDFEQSRFKAFLDGTELPTRFGRVFRPLFEQPHPDPDTVLFTTFLRDVLPAAIARPWTFYVGPLAINEQDDEDPTPSMGFLINPGDGPEGQAVERWLLEQFDRFKDRPGVQLIEHGDLLGIVVGRPFLNPDDPDKPANITTAARFNQTLEGMGDKPVFVGYLDVVALNKMLHEVAMLAGGAGDLGSVERITDMLGVAEARAAAVTGSFEQRDWVQRVFIDLPAGDDGTRRGLPALLLGTASPPAELAAAPASANWFRTLHLDPAGVLDMIRKGIEAEGDDDALIDFETGLKDASDEVGFDIEQDLIRPTGNRWTLFSEPAFGSIAGFYPGIVVMHTLEDAAKVDASLLKFRDYMNRWMQADGVPFQIASMELGEVTVHSFAFPMAAPSWAVHEGKLAIAASATAITTAFTGAKGPSITDQADYAAMLQRLTALSGRAADAPVNGLMYADLPKSSIQMYQSYVMIFNLFGGFMNDFGAGPAINMNELIPPFNSIQPHLAPAGDMLWADDKGLHFVSVSPFPGATLLSPDAVLTSGLGVPTMVPMWLGVTMPALGAARGAARQMQASTQARGIHQGMILEAQAKAPDAQGRRPLTDDIVSLIDGNYFTPEYAISPFAGIIVPKDYRNWDLDKRANWMHRNASYVIIPGQFEDFDSTKVSLFLKPSHSNRQGISVTFNDNATRWMSVAEAEELIKKQTGKTIAELVEAVESKAPEGTPDELAEARARREAVLEEIRARRAAELQP